MKDIKIRGNRFFYEDINPEKEEVILLVHGHPFDHSMWKYQFDELNNFRLILPDLKGYGKSDYDFNKIYIEEQALDLALLLDELKIEKVHLIGLSMGGQIIVEFHRLFSNRVQSLIICASIPNAETEESYRKRINLAEEINKIGMAEYTKRDIHKYINLNEIESNVYNHLFEMMSKTKKEGAVASHKGRAERRNNLDYIKKIQTPTLLIAGEMDFFFKAEEVQKVANEIPKAEFKIIKKSGHLPNMEKTNEFNKLLADFYKY